MFALSSSLPQCPKFPFTRAANFCKHKAATGFPCLLELESQENTLHIFPPQQMQEAAYAQAAKYTTALN